MTPERMQYLKEIMLEAVKNDRLHSAKFSS